MGNQSGERRERAWRCDLASLPARDHGPAEGHGKHTLPISRSPLSAPVILQSLQNPAVAELAVPLKTT